MFHSRHYTLDIYNVPKKIYVINKCCSFELSIHFIIINFFQHWKYSNAIKCLNPNLYTLSNFSINVSLSHSFFPTQILIVHFLSFLISINSVCSICHQAHLLSHVHRKQNRVSLHPFICLSCHSFIHLRNSGLVKIMLSLRKTLPWGAATAMGDDSVCSHIPPGTIKGDHLHTHINTEVRKQYHSSNSLLRQKSNQMTY